ncbi:MAG: hypothetical protein IBJ03_06165 [Gemmatimonadaceae bacterium]|nr:hypothetical protein [Gemmatimonadaceae bacterium]
MKHTLKHTHITFGLLFAVATPTLVIAQSAGQTGTQSGTQSSAQTGVQSSAQVTAEARVEIPEQFSAESKAQLTKLYADARAQGLSEVAISKRVAEGVAKGATESAIVTSAQGFHAQMVTTQEAMIRAGREKPAGDEVERGANAMARGVTAVQIEGLTRGAPADRSLSVAFEVLSDLAASGVPVATALTQMQLRIDQRASDASLRELGTSLGATLGAGAGIRKNN